MRRSKNAVPRLTIPNDRGLVARHLRDAKNQIAWRQIDGFPEWLATSRLDRYTEMMIKARAEPTPIISDIIARYQAALKPGLARMKVLLEEAEQSNDRTNPAK